jgi:hypothetical protein
MASRYILGSTVTRTRTILGSTRVGNRYGRMPRVRSTTDRLGVAYALYPRSEAHVTVRSRKCTKRCKSPAIEPPIAWVSRSSPRDAAHNEQANSLEPCGGEVCRKSLRRTRVNGVRSIPKRLHKGTRSAYRIRRRYGQKEIWTALDDRGVRKSTCDLPPQPALQRRQQVYVTIHMDGKELTN